MHNYNYGIKPLEQYHKNRTSDKIFELFFIIKYCLKFVRILKNLLQYDICCVNIELKKQQKFVTILQTLLRTYETMLQTATPLHL